MKFVNRFVKAWTSVLMALIVVLGITGCNTAKIESKPEPLPIVAALPNPKLPDWIEDISPTGDADTLAQIRIRFKEALIPLESIDNPDQQEKLKQFAIVPALPGQFRFLTPRMVGFQADKALPKATRVQVTLKSGLADLKNHKLTQDLVWTFNTEKIKLSDVPTIELGKDIEPIALKPTLKITSNVELDPDSLKQHTQLLPKTAKSSDAKAVSLKITQEKSDASATEGTPAEQPDQPQEQFDPSLKTWIYQLTPEQPLATGTRYDLAFTPGLQPVGGNLPSDTTFKGAVETYSPLAFKTLTNSGAGSGRFEQGSGQLEFNNGIDAESALKSITVSPAPYKSPKLVQIYEGDKVVRLNPWALAPATTYTVTIAPDLKDRFGQTLGKAVTVKYATGNVTGDIWAPNGLNIFPTNKDLQLNISTVNLPESRYKAAYRVVQPTDLVYTDSAYPKGDGNDLLPDPSKWKTFKASGRKNQSVENAVPLRQQLKAATGMLAYGVQARTTQYEDNGQKKWNEPSFYGLVQSTNIGVFAQWFPESGIVKAHRLADGSPIANATIEIYPSQLEAKSRPTPVACATGKTDAAGTLALNQPALQKCMDGGKTFTKGPALLVIAREGQDWAFTRTNEYSGAYGYDINAEWQSGKPESRGTIFSDRQLYQPGEKAAFTGIAYYLQNGTLQRDSNARYAITAEGPEGQKTDLGSQATNDFGTFSVDWTIPANLSLGYYSIRAIGENGVEISGEFRVAEFKPPNFKVDLAIDREFAMAGDKIQANAASSYLFGAPVEGGKAKYYITRRQATLSPKGWEQFSFGRRWFWPEEAPAVPSDVLQGNQVLDKQGKNTQLVPVAKDLPYPMTYQVDVEVTDVSNLSVASSKTFTALPTDKLIGLQSNFVADAGKAFPVQVMVTDATGKAVSNQTVRLELQSMQYSSVTRVVEGSETPQNQVEYKTIAKSEVRSGDTPQSVSLTAPDSGSYRIQANLADGGTDATATDLQVWVTGQDAVNWGNREGDRLEIKLDKDTYKVGETATALIQSPYPDAELAFLVVRDKPLYQTITKVKGGAPQIQFQVTPEMLPNAAVEAVLIRQGQPLNQVEPGKLSNLSRVGMVGFKVNLDDQYLKVQVTPQQASLLPGAEQTVQLQLQDAQGKSVSGQFIVMAVNEAILQLSGYRLPDLVKTVYAEQSIATRFSDNRPDVVLQPLSSPLEKGWGYGGGLSTGAANTRVRKDFRPLAYYGLATAENGQATVKFTLPDDLTTWRVMAIGTAGEPTIGTPKSATGVKPRFGTADATFITTQPLLSNPILPQFARPGDRLQAGLSVTNTTGQPGALTINSEITPPLQFVDKQSQTASLQTQVESGTQAYRFPIAVGSPGKAQVRFTTQLNNGGSDAFEVPLEVKPLEVTEQVVETGTTDNQAKIPLNVDNKVALDAGGLEVSLASTLIPAITTPARQVLDEEQLPFLEPAASQLTIASSLLTLSQQYKQILTGFDVTQQTNQALETLQKLQQPDGGFAAYPGQKSSDPLVTPYAARSLAGVNAAAPNRATLVTGVKTYLNKLLADPGQYDYCKADSCKAQVRLESLLALADLGDRRNDFLADIYAQQKNFTLLNRIKLSRYLSQFPDWQQEAQTLSKQIQKVIYDTGRTATVGSSELGLPENRGWISSSTAAQAEALRLLIAQKAKPEAIDRLLQGLLSQRRNGTWQTSYDNAVALAALVDYAKTQPTPPDFAATVQLAGKTLGSAQFKGYSNPSQEIRVPIAELPKGKNDLILNKSGRGTLHYLAAYRYRLQGNQPGRLNGIRVIREIRPANQDKVIRKLGIYAPEEALTVQPGQVFDIGLQVITDHPVNNVVITDPLPAGFEAVDASFQTATPYFQSKGDSWEIGYQTIHRDRIVAYADQLAPGVYTLHYLVRSVTPGTFFYPGGEAHLQYAPEEFGRTASSTLTIADQ